MGRYRKEPAGALLHHHQGRTEGVGARGRKLDAAVDGRPARVVEERIEAAMSWLARLLNVFRAEKVVGRHRSRTDLPSRRARRRTDRRRRLPGGRASRGAASPRQLHVPAGEHPRARPAGLAGDDPRRPALRAARARQQSDLRGTTILTLAIGIGANTTVFTLLHGLLLRSLPVTAPHELVRVNLTARRSRPAAVCRYGLLQRFGELQRTFVDISGWRSQPVSIEEGDGTLRQSRRRWSPATGSRCSGCDRGSAA